MKYSVRFYLKTKHGADSSTPAHIRLSVFWATQRVEMHTGLRVSPDYWVQQERRAKNSYRSGITIGSDINRELSSIETFVVDVLLQYRLERSTPLPNSLKHQFGRYFGSVLDNTDADIYDCIDIFTDTMSHQIGWTPGALTKFRTIKKHLQTFSPKHIIADLTEDGLPFFMCHLLKAVVRRNNINTTIRVGSNG